jgi:hypothetical protein
MKSFYQLMLEMEGEEPMLAGAFDNSGTDLSPTLPQKLTLNIWLQAFDSLVAAIENENEADKNDIGNFRYDVSILRGIAGSLQQANRQPISIAHETLRVAMKRYYQMMMSIKRLSRFNLPSAEILFNFMQYNEKKFEAAIKAKIY